MKLIQEFVNQSDLKKSDGSSAGAHDVKNKGADVQFNLMRNTINSDGKVTGSSVANYLEKAHDLNDEVETVLYGLETSDGKVVKVYVNAAQSDAFEVEMKKMLGMEDDIEDAINNLAAKFDIVDVIWPKGEGEDAEQESADDDVSLDDAADIGDPSEEDEDDDMETIASVDDELDGAVAPDDDDDAAPIEGEEDLADDEEVADKKDKKKGDEDADDEDADDETSPEDETPADDSEADDKKDKKKDKKDKHSLLKSIGGGLAGKEKIAEELHEGRTIADVVKGGLLNAWEKRALKFDTYEEYAAFCKRNQHSMVSKKAWRIFKDELAKQVTEGEVIKADFSKGKGVDNQGIEIPKGYDRFEVDGKRIVGFKGDKKFVISTTSDERLAQELVRVYNGGKASTTMKPVSLLQAFGSREMAAAEAVDIRLTEKPSYWEEFEEGGHAAKRNFDQLKLKKLEKTVGKLKEYSGKDIYGIDVKPRGPLRTVNTMPPEDMFIVRFSDGSRYVADKTGANTYIRMWQKIN